MTSDTSWGIFGCRTAVAPEIAEIIWRRGADLAAVVDNLRDPVEQPWAGDVPVTTADAIPEHFAALSWVVPQTTPEARRSVVAAAIELGLSNLPALLDPTATIARTAHIARGVVVCAGAIVGALTTVDEFAFVNRGATLAHHCRIGRFASLGPRAVLTGTVTVEEGAFVGAGAVVVPGVTIGANATVGAGSVVLRDVPPGAVVVGNPARVIRHGSVTLDGSAERGSE